MRVVAGEYRGRTIKAVPGQNTRPTLDKVKESVFNALGQFFTGGIVLDLYAGSGNLGIEALSRGCDKAFFVDKHYLANKVIKENIDTLKLNDYTHVYKLDAFAALNLFKKENVKFDYIFLDPPYKQAKIDEIITFLVDHDMLSDDAIIMSETLKEAELMETYMSVYKFKEFIYGITKVTLYKNEGDSIE